MARLFYYYQQQGKLDAAQQTITAFRLHKEAAIQSGRARNSTSVRACWKTFTLIPNRLAIILRCTTARA